MSAENAWRIAVETAASTYRGDGEWDTFGEFERTLLALPMPPAFRAAVEAEARAFAQREHPYADLHVEALAEIKATIDGNSDQPVAAIIEGLLEEIRARSDRLSRLEAKGEEKP